MSELARRVGMSRDGLYKALSAGGNPTWSTILKVTNALGLRFELHTVVAADLRERWISGRVAALGPAADPGGRDAEVVGPDGGAGGVGRYPRRCRVTAASRTASWSTP